jgi:terminase large subunit-like protein
LKKGRAKTGGRRKGVKDRIGTMFLEELAKDFEEHGPELIRLARIERPVEYLKIIAATLPKEFELTDSRLEEISDGELDALIELARQQRAIIVNAERREEPRQIENRLAYYKPYPKQAEFRAAKARERLLMAGNQLGKTLAGGFEAAMYATGRYPDWWQGERFDRSTVGWCCGVTGEVVRDTVQKVLVGRPGQIGTGSIPKDAIGELVTARGITDLLDVIKVRYESGGTSLIMLKSYLSGREKFQGENERWRPMPNENNSTSEDRFGRQDQQEYSSRSSLGIIAIIVIVIGILVLMYFRH